MKRVISFLLSVILVLGLVPVTIFAEESTTDVVYEKATSVTVGKEYLIVGKGSSNNYALTNAGGKKKVTISSNTITVTSDDAKSIEWKAGTATGDQVDGGDYTFISNDKYLGKTSGEYTLSFYDEANKNDKRIGFDYKNNALLNCDTYYLSYNSTDGFIFTKDTSEITLYEKQSSETSDNKKATETNISVEATKTTAAEKDVTIKVGEVLVISLKHSSSANKTFTNEVDDNTVLKITEGEEISSLSKSETGTIKVKGLKAGTAVVTCTGSSNSGSDYIAKINVTVTGDKTSEEPTTDTVYTLADKFEIGKTYLIVNANNGAGKALTNTASSSFGTADVTVKDNKITASGLKKAEWEAKNTGTSTTEDLIGLYNGSNVLKVDASNSSSPYIKTSGTSYNAGGFGYTTNGHISYPYGSNPKDYYIGSDSADVFTASSSESGLGKVYIFVKGESGGTDSPSEPITPEGSATYVAFTSDVHNQSGDASSTRLNNWINKVTGSSVLNAKLDNFGFAGDLGPASGSSDTFWTNAQKVMDVINKSENITNKNKGFYVCGNHEFSPGSYSNSKNSTTKEYSDPGKYEIYDDYILYSMGASQGSEEYLSKNITALESFLEDNKDFEKPIFILAHYPLHCYSSSSYWGGSSSTTGESTTIHDGKAAKGSSEMIQVMNKAAEEYGQTIVFLWGHNHSGSNDHYDAVYTDKINNTNIKFVYAAAGCMSDSEYGSSANVKGKGSVAAIYDNCMTFTYYTADGTVVGTPVTISYDGTTSDTPVTPVDNSDVEISPTTENPTINKTIAVGDKFTVKIKNATENSNSWTYSLTVKNTSVATADKDSTEKLGANEVGEIIITGVKAGTTTINITNGNTDNDGKYERKATINLTVTDGTTPSPDTPDNSDVDVTPQKESAGIPEENKTIVVGSSFNVNVTNGSEHEGTYKFTAKSEDDEVASINPDTIKDLASGKTGTMTVTGLKKGTTTILIRNNNTEGGDDQERFAKIHLTVVEKSEQPSEDVTADITSSNDTENVPEINKEVKVGETVEVTLKNGHAEKALTYKAVFGTANIAEANPAEKAIAAGKTEKFTFKGLKPGTTKVTLMADGYYAVVNLTVTGEAEEEPTEAKLSYYVLTDTLEKGETYLIVNADDGEGKALSNTKDDSFGTKDVIIANEIITATDLEAAEWEADVAYEGQDSNIGFFNDGTVLKVEKDSDNYNITTNGTEYNKNNKFTFESNNLKFKVDSSNSYYIVQSDTTEFKGYKSAISSKKIYLFVKVDLPYNDGLTLTPTSSSSPEKTVIISEGESFNVTIKNGSSTAYTYGYTIDDYTIATSTDVAKQLEKNETQTYTFTGLKAGNTQIKFSNGASSHERKATINLYVIEKEKPQTPEKAKNSITNFTCADVVYGEKAPFPVATAEYGSAEFSYSKEENGEYGAWNKANDAGTYYVKAFVAETEEYESATDVIAFEVKPADLTITKPQAKEGLVESDTNLELIIPGSVEGEYGTFQYKLAKEGEDLTEYSAEIPTAKDEGEYTVYFIVLGDKNHNNVAEDSLTVKIEKKQEEQGPSEDEPEDEPEDEETVTFVKTNEIKAGKEYIIVAKSGNTENKYYALSQSATKLKYVISDYVDTKNGKIVIPETLENEVVWTTAAATGTRLTGGALTLTNGNKLLGRDSGDNDVVFGTSDTKYFGFTFENGRLKNIDTNSVYLGYGEPSESGEYTFCFTTDADYGELTYYVKETETEEPEEPEEKDKNEITSFTCEDITFGGTPSPEAEASYGIAAFSYSDSEDGVYGAWNTENGVGTYYVKATVAETEEYEGAEKIISFKVNKANATIDKYPEAKNLTANGENQNLVTAGSAIGGEMLYKLGKESDLGEYSKAIPAAKDVGEYTVTYYVKGDDNHNDSEKKAITVNIKEASSENTVTFKKTSKMTEGKEYIIVAKEELQLMMAAANEEPTVTKAPAKVNYIYYALTNDSDNNNKAVIDSDSVSGDIITLAEDAAKEIAFTAAKSTGSRANGGDITLSNGGNNLGRQTQTQNVVFGVADTAYFGLSISDGNIQNKGWSTYYLGYGEPSEGSENTFHFFSDKNKGGVEIYEKFDGTESEPEQEENSIKSLYCADVTYGEAPRPVGYAEKGTITYTYSDKENGKYGMWNNLNNVGTYYVKASVAETEEYEGAEKIVSFKVKAKDLTVTGTTAKDKEYDGNKKANATIGTVDGIVTGSRVEVKIKSAEFYDENAGTNKYVLVKYELSGWDKENYNAPKDSTVTANINQKQLTVDGTKVSEKTYDGTTTATATAGQLKGVLTGDKVTVEIKSANFNDQYAGTNKNVTVQYKISGNDAVNYMAPEDSNIKGQINKKLLTVVGTQVSDKEYDGKTTAEAKCGVLSGVIGYDNVWPMVVSAQFSDNKAATNKQVTVKYALAGLSSANYYVEDEKLTADITPAAIKVIGTTVNNKEYDGNKKATAKIGMVYGIVAGSRVEVKIKSAEFYDENAGMNKQVLVKYELSGWDKGNYSVPEDSALTANITQKQLYIVGTKVSEKTYDGTTAAEATAGYLKGVLFGDKVTVEIKAANFNNPYAGIFKNVNVQYKLSGDDAANYKAPEDSNIISQINRKLLTVVGTEAYDKAYDGKSNAEVKCGTLSGVVGYDIVWPVVISAKFSDKDSAVDKEVTVKYALFGLSALNYYVEDSKLTADITPLTLTVTAEDKSMFQGGKLPEFTYTVEGFINDETFVKEPKLTTTANGKRAGEFPIVASDADAGVNYIINYVDGTLTVYCVDTVEVIIDGIYDEDKAVEVEENPNTGAF